MPEPESPRTTVPSVAHRAVSGAMWSTAAGLVARGLSLIGTVLIVRFLAPADYGAVQNASIVVLTASQLATLGIGPYIIAFPNAGRAVAFHATFIHVFLGTLALAAVWLFADRLGPAFDAPQLAKFVPGLILSVFLDRLSFMAERPVVRDLHFRQVSISRTLGEISYTAASLFFAWRGHGAMAVVYGNVARSIVRLLSLVAISDWREWALPAPLRRKTMNDLVSYGTVMAVQALAEFGSRRWDNLLVGRLFGSGVAGRYILAYNLSDLPAIQIGEQIADVLLASYSRVDPERRAPAVLRAATLMALIMAPLSIGLGAVGPTVAHTFFKPEWAVIGTMMMILSSELVVRPIGAVYAGFLIIVRGPRLPMVAELIGVALLLGLVLTVGRMGPLWVCGMVGVAFSLRTLIYMYFVQRLDGIRVVDGLKRFLPIFAACLPMVAAVFGVRHGLRALGHDWPALSLALEVIAGGLAYALFAFLLARRAVDDLVGLLRAALRRRLGK